MIVVEGDSWVNAPRNLAFVLAPSDQGTLIVNRFDRKINAEGQGIGVGFMVLNQGSYDSQDISFARFLLGLRRRHFGDGVAVVDCGANIGIMTLEWAKAMTGWGSVLAIEAQERVFYALAGNCMPPWERRMAYCAFRRRIIAVRARSAVWSFGNDRPTRISANPSTTTKRG